MTLPETLLWLVRLVEASNILPELQSQAEVQSQAEAEALTKAGGPGPGPGPGPTWPLPSHALEVPFQPRHCLVQVLAPEADPEVVAGMAEP